MGRIVTFYSYKGGTGRSMLLANFAWILAANGKKVLTLDWDLEAPGLHRYFRPFLIDPELTDTNGLIDISWTFAGSALARAPSSQQTAAQSGKPGAVALALDSSKRRLKWPFPNEGFIDFVGAGRQGPTYSERVNTFDWKRFYELGGAQALKDAKAQLAAQYDWVLIDSRTGVTDTAGICTMQLPNIVVACFTLNRQSIHGVTAVMRSIRNYRSATVNGADLKFFPLATRIENAEQEKLEVARRYARGLMAEFIPEPPKTTPRPERSEEERPGAYWERMEIAYRPAYAFEEVLAIFGDASDAARASDTLLAQIERVSQRISEDENLRAPRDCRGRSQRRRCELRAGPRGEGRNSRACHAGRHRVPAPAQRQGAGVANLRVPVASFDEPPRA
jgi:cellulose biosynthesis protein BcsQ